MQTAKSPTTSLLHGVKRFQRSRRMSRPLAKLVIKRATLPLLAQPAQFGALETLLDRDPLAASILRRSRTVRRLFALPRRICHRRVASRNNGTTCQFCFCTVLPANRETFCRGVLTRPTAADGIGRTSPPMDPVSAGKDRLQNLRRQILGKRFP